GPALADRPYLADKLGTAEFGTPRALPYLHLLKLPTLVDEKGAKVELKPGTQIEYWLEAADACDVRTPPVVARSKSWKILIADQKQDDNQQKKDQKEAENREQEHKKQQEQDLKNEQKERQDQKKKEKEQNDRDEEQHKKEKADNGKKGE